MPTSSRSARSPLEVSSPLLTTPGSQPGDAASRGTPAAGPLPRNVAPAFRGGQRRSGDPPCLQSSTGAVDLTGMEQPSPRLRWARLARLRHHLRPALAGAIWAASRLASPRALPSLRSALAPPSSPASPSRPTGPRRPARSGPRPSRLRPVAVHQGGHQRTAATQVRQPHQGGIETGIQGLLLGNEHRASKPARHGIRQRTLVLDLTPGR